MRDHYRLFTWGLSYFSAKIRAYMRYKAFHGALKFEEILATQDLMMNYIVPATGAAVVPQVQTPKDDWLQDSSEIIDALESIHPEAPVVPSTPRQRLVSYLIELLADEWMLPWGFWERWHYSLKDVAPNHEAFNAQQWGPIFNADGTGLERREAARFVFKEMMRIDNPAEAVVGPYSGLVQLGVTEKTEAAWTTSIRNMLSLLETHFDTHDFVLGGRPTLGDFALMGPLYAHLYRDPVPGFMMRTEFPLVCEWIERTNGSDESGIRSYKQSSYKFENGELVGQPAATNNGELLADDQIPDSLLPFISVFFDEMWPALKLNAKTVTDYLAGPDVDKVAPLPGKSFYAPPEFSELQSKGGALNYEFEIGGVTECKMASPYQIWMLQRLNSAMSGAFQDEEQKTRLTDFLTGFNDGTALLNLDQLLKGCRVRKQFEQIYAD
jgi:glutathione S-transferase